MCVLDGRGDVVCGCVVGGWSCDVTDHMGGVGGGAVYSRGVASGLECPPVGGGGEAGVVGGVVDEVGGVGVRKRRGGGQIGSRGRSFIREVQQWGRGEGRLLWVQERRGGGGGWRGAANGRGAFHCGGGACGGDKRKHLYLLDYATQSIGPVRLSVGQKIRLHG